MNRTLKKILSTGRVVNKDGTERILTSAIGPDEVAFLERTIGSLNPFRTSVEVGCAYGISSLVICEALSKVSGDRKHHIVDPCQLTDYKGNGIHHLKEEGFNFFELHATGSEIALPWLIANGSEKSVDLVFIDGWHTFDHTLLDIFYAVRLLRVGGILVVDDAGQPAVGRAIGYLSQYPCMQLVDVSHGGGGFIRRLASICCKIIPFPVARVVMPAAMLDAIYSRSRFGSMAAFKKIAEDTRPWNWYCKF